MASEQSLTTETLRLRLTRRLNELENEAVTIRRALAALGADAEVEPHRGPRRRLRPGDVERIAPTAPPTLGADAHPARDRMLDAVRDSPGSRASMLALTAGLSVDTVRQHLEVLEQAGHVQRDGLGWRTVAS